MAGILEGLRHSILHFYFYSLPLSVRASSSQPPMISATPLCFSRPVLLFSVPKPRLKFTPLEQQKKTKTRIQTCRAHLSDDAPFALAMAASMLSSLLLPVTDAPRPDQADSAIDSTDTRFAVMGILSFIPYFNWLSWVFAWLDTGKRRYAVYSLVYLAPYLRSNLSLSPEESWLPIASIVFCLVHIQLEASIRNGDIQGLQIFRAAVNRLSSRKKGGFGEHEEMSTEGSRKEDMNLPPPQEQSRETGWQEDPKRPIQHLNEELDDDEM